MKLYSKIETLIHIYTACIILRFILNLIKTLIFLVNIQSQFLLFGSLPFHDNLVLCKRIPTNRRIWT